MLSDCLEDWELNAELIVALESFVCHLYRYKNFRYQQSLKRIVWQKASVGKKKSWVYHCCHLDSSHYICTSCSQIMLQGFGYVIYSMWSKCPSIMENGLIESSEIIHVDDAFPQDITEILFDEDFDKGSMELE